MKSLLYSFLILILFSCKVKKDIHLQEIKTHSITRIDSNYIDSINGQITINRAYVIDYDSLGRPMSAKINEVVKGSYNGVSKGSVRKDEEVKNEVKTLDKKIDKESVTVNFSLILFVVLVVIGLVVFYSCRSWSK
ncbi:hypothetical protein [Pedobacter gandavensis]|uniref:hypothetical protein n=1 Tax=Pedobacter gandavensis TaxID=2679963 RepID=UPI00292DC4BA|nr:hypothetical protein [Pedobacter gandavensis]